MRAKYVQTLGACPQAHVALKPPAPGFKYATDRGLIAPEVPVAFLLILRSNLQITARFSGLGAIDECFGAMLT